MKNLGYYIINGESAFKSVVQIESLIEQGHNVQPITEEEYYLMFEEYSKTFKYVS
jgi:hypothetical protein